MDNLVDARLAPLAQLLLEPWEWRPVGLILPMFELAAVVAQANRWHVDEGGRFEGRGSAIVLHSSTTGDIEGAILLRWGVPDDRFGVVDAIAWNTRVGGTHAEVATALDLLLGVAVIVPLDDRAGA